MNRIKRYIPIIDTLLNYNLDKAKKDTVAAITVAVISVPQAMAYAMLAGLNPIYGVYTAILAPIIGGIFSSSNYLLFGPTNTAALLLAGTLSRYIGLDNFYQIVFLLTFLVGVSQLLIGLFRLGNLINYVSHTVIVGFITGAACIIALGQLIALFGLEVPVALHTTLQKIIYVFTHLNELNLAALLLGVFSIITIVVLKKINKNIPGALIVILTASAISALVYINVQTIGHIPSGLPKFTMINFDFGIIPSLLGSVFTLAIIGFMEAVSISKSIANISDEPTRANQTAISLGLSNIIPSFFQCFVSSGSFTRSSVNYFSGAKTKIAGILSSVFVAIVFLFFGKYVQYIPLSTLAGIIIITALNMIDKKEIKKILSIKGPDQIILVVTCLSTILLPNLSWAIFIGIVLSMILFIRKNSAPTVKVLCPKHIGEETVFIEEPLDDVAHKHPIIMLQLEGNLYFASSHSLLDQLKSTTDIADIYILRLKHVHCVDVTSAKALKLFISELINRSKTVIISGINDSVYTYFKKLGIVDIVGEKNIYKTYDQILKSSITAYEAAESLLDS